MQGVQTHPPWVLHPTVLPLEFLNNRVEFKQFYFYYGTVGF